MYFFIQILLCFVAFYASFLQASSPFNVQFPLSAEKLSASKEQQKMALQNEPKKKTIGTIDALHSAIDQAFIYGKIHKGIGLKEFFEKHTEVVEEFKQDVQSVYTIPYEQTAMIYAELEQNPTARDIRYYKIVGALLPSIYFDRDNIPSQDALFYIDKAKSQVLRAAKKYIDDNYEAVFAKCYELASSENQAHQILSVPCCKTQFHGNCLINCKNYKIDACPNVTCPVAGYGSLKATKWDTSFYTELLKQPALDRKDIASGTCLLCEDQLKPTIAGTSLETIRKRKVHDYDCNSKRQNQYHASSSSLS